MSEGESHFHPCPGCSEVVECWLAIGDSACGKLRCANCSIEQPYKDGPQCRAASKKGFVCTLAKGHGGVEHVAHNSSGICDRWPMIAPAVADGEEPDDSEDCSGCGHKYGRHSNGKTGSCHEDGCKCPHWNADPVEAEEEEGEAETCDNCGKDITPENPAMDFNGDSHCKDCYPICKDCEEALKPEGYFRCEKCEEYLCEDCARWCQCCEIYLCESHAGDHGT